MMTTNEIKIMMGMLNATITFKDENNDGFCAYPMDMRSVPDFEDDLYSMGFMLYERKRNDRHEEIRVWRKRGR